MRSMVLTLEAKGAVKSAPPDDGCLAARCLTVVVAGLVVAAGGPARSVPAAEVAVMPAADAAPVPAPVPVRPVDVMARDLWEVPRCVTPFSVRVGIFGKLKPFDVVVGPFDGGDVGPWSVVVTVEVSAGVDVSAGGKEATTVAGVVETTAAGVTVAVVTPKVPEAAEEAEEGSDAGSTPVVPELVVQRPWHGMPLEVEVEPEPAIAAGRP